MKLMGTYAGIVEANNDPEKLGRVKARVPHVYGSTLVAGSIGTDDLPWAFPAGLPAGQSSLSGGFSMLPEVGDRVWVRFLDGEPEKPVYEWGMQTQKGAEDMEVHSYNEQGGKVVGVKSTRWTRYGHVAEINPDSVTLTSQSGYFLQIVHSTEQQGQIIMATPLGNYLYVDDEADGIMGFANEDAAWNCGSAFSILCKSFDCTTLQGDAAFVNGRKFTVEATDNIELSTLASLDVSAEVNASLSANVNMDLSAEVNMDISAGAAASFTFATLHLGSLAATQPFVLGTFMVQFCTTLLTWLASHTHSNGNEGAPTGPPIVPPTGAVTPTPAQLISTTIFGQ
jgi:hypothetical protein